MTKAELRAAVAAAKEEARAALQAVYDALNQGQRKKLLRDETVKAYFERFGVMTDDEA